MARKTQFWLLSMFLCILVGGCTGHRVRYQPIVKCQIPPSTHAVAVSGSIDSARECFEKAQLPHNSPRQKLQLMMDGLTKLTSQLGSPDYVLIGEVHGGGNAWANQTTLTKAFCDKAAKYGGDVVLIFNRATIEQPYVYSTPGYSTTNTTVNAYGQGNYATAYGTSYTTHVPGQTYSGVMYKPQGNALVFKHVPGVDQERMRLLETPDDDSLARALQSLEQLGDYKGLSWEEARSKWNEVVLSANK